MTDQNETTMPDVIWIYKSPTVNTFYVTSEPNPDDDTPYARIPDTMDADDAAVVSRAERDREDELTSECWEKQNARIDALKSEIKAYDLRMTNDAATIATLTAERDALQAIVDKLPKYEDTGEPFVHGKDAAWVKLGGDVMEADQIYHDGDEWASMHPCEYEGWETYYDIKFFSTPDAAKAGDVGMLDDYDTDELRHMASRLRHLSRVSPIATMSYGPCGHPRRGMYPACLECIEKEIDKRDTLTKGK